MLLRPPPFPNTRWCDSLPSPCAAALCCPRLHLSTADLPAAPPRQTRWWYGAGPRRRPTRRCRSGHSTLSRPATQVRTLQADVLAAPAESHQFLSRPELIDGVPTTAALPASARPAPAERGTIGNHFQLRSTAACVR